MINYFLILVLSFFLTFTSNAEHLGTWRIEDFESGYMDAISGVHRWAQMPSHKDYMQGWKIGKKDRKNFSKWEKEKSFNGGYMDAFSGVFKVPRIPYDGEYMRGWKRGREDRELEVLILKCK